MNLILLFPDDFTSSATVRLTGRRRQHLLAVQRIAVGDSLCVGLVDGAIGRAEVSRLDPDAVELVVTLNDAPPAPLPVRLVLALPRPKVLKRVLISAVSMGVKQIHLVNSCRVEKSFWKSPLLTPEKLREPLLLGLEQARDTVLPQVGLHPLFKPFVEDQLPALAADTTRLVAHPGGETLFPARAPGPATLVVGPEGGFVPFEIAKLREGGFTIAGFGPRILRVETAVPALLSRFAEA